MIEHIAGDLLKTNVQVKVHQVNCYGVMGAGIAKQIKQQYPDVFSIYKKYCNAHTPADLIGHIQVIPIHNGNTYICNLFRQKGYGFQKVQTDYLAFRTAVKELVSYMKKEGLTSVGCPKYIGCGLAGGDWNIVYGIIERHFGSESNIHCVIVEYNGMS